MANKWHWTMNNEIKNNLLHYFAKAFGVNVTLLLANYLTSLWSINHWFIPEQRQISVQIIDFLCRSLSTYWISLTSSSISDWTLLFSKHFPSSDPPCLNIFSSMNVFFGSVTVFNTPVQVQKTSWSETPLRVHSPALWAEEESERVCWGSIWGKQWRVRCNHRLDQLGRVSLVHSVLGGGKLIPNLNTSAPKSLLRSPRVKADTHPVTLKDLLLTKYWSGFIDSEINCCVIYFTFFPEKCCSLFCLSVKSSLEPILMEKIILGVDIKVKLIRIKLKCQE